MAKVEFFLTTYLVLLVHLVIEWPFVGLLFPLVTDHSGKNEGLHSGTNFLYKNVHSKYHKHWLYTFTSTNDCRGFPFSVPKKVHFKCKIDNFPSLKLITLLVRALQCTETIKFAQKQKGQDSFEFISYLGFQLCFLTHLVCAFVFRYNINLPRFHSVSIC